MISETYILVTSRSIPSQLVPLAARLAAPYLVLHLMSFTSLQACGIIQTRKSHPPVGTRHHPTLLLLQSLSPTVPAASLYDLYVALHGMWCPPAGCEYMGPINRCQSHLLRPVSLIQFSLEP